jgi:hypothetical protein
MKTTLLPCILSAFALAFAGCSKEPTAATGAPAVKKEEPKKEESRPMPPSAPTAAPAEGEKK